MRSIYDMMKQRCFNKNNKDYKHYGARGITVCDSWCTSFEAFCNDMGERPKGTTLDRIDNNKGYSPENCRWITRAEQQNNTRANKYITYNGETLNHTQWSRRLGGNRQLVARRIRLGWTEERAVTTPI